MTERTLEQLPARVTVMGAARSGLAAARYLHDNGVTVFVTDTCPADKLDFVLAGNGLAHLAHEAGGHTARALECDAIVLSPGIRSDHPILRSARKRGIPVWSEIELGFRRSRARFLAVTGSSGKSTTVSMLGSIAACSGHPSVVAGNIGVPVIGVAPELPPDGFVVVEVSSFQLETVETFKPRVAAVLNFLKNHLDRYESEDAYYNAKKGIACNLDPSCDLVVNACDDRLRTWALQEASRTNVSFFGRREDGYRSVWYQDGAIVAAWGGAVERIFEVSAMKVAGRHNYDNAAAAAASALAAGIPVAAIAEGLRTFEGLPHRLQAAGTYGGVAWYNDSKSTTAESVRVAIVAFPGKVHLIAGGRDKGCDFTVVNDVIPTHVKEVILIGEAAARMQGVWKGLTSIVRVGTLQEAIEKAAAESQPGDVVVFSPGCSSFDMFRDYEERGLTFMTAVRETAPKFVAARRRGDRS